MRLLKPGFSLNGLTDWLSQGSSLREECGAHTGTESSCSSIVNCIDARTVVHDAAREELRRQARHYCAERDVLGHRWNRLTIPGGGARLSSELFPKDYRQYRDDLRFAAQHQFMVDDDPCMVILITHVGCGKLAIEHPELSFEGALHATYQAGVEIAKELDDLERGAVVIVVADGLVGSLEVERYRCCGLILSGTRRSLLPEQQHALTECAEHELVTHLG